jgi:plasmid maintenance system killer protein
MIRNFRHRGLREKPSYSVHVNGPWCLVFAWRDGEAMNVDLVNYH